MTPVNANIMTLQQLLVQLQMDSTAITSDAQAVSNPRLTAYQQLAQASPILDIPFRQFQLDSRQVISGDAFILLKSQSHSLQRSRDYAEQAMVQAAFILSEVDPSTLNLTETKCPIIYVPAIRHILGSLIQASLQHQTVAKSKELGNEAAIALPKVAAVTGTNGKTTVSQLLAQLCQGAGMSSAIMGTAGNGRLGHLTQASHTTGDALAVQQFLMGMANESVDMLALEASSHGLDQLRLQGVPIEVAIYTNLSRDHLDYHTDMAEYAAAKAKLFDCKQFGTLTHAVINIDDEFAPLMLEQAAKSGLEVWTYSLRPDAQASFVARQIQPSLEGSSIEIAGSFAPIWVESPLLGRFNVANLLAAIAAAVALGVDVKQIPELVKSLQGASGRMQRVEASEGCFIVDYAHTPDALQQVMSSLKAHCQGQLWAVFGCGGDRDAGKRPLMAQAGLAVADQVILTSDNPRSEDPLAILKDMQVGMSAAQRERTHIEPDRRQAIGYAVQHAKVDDIVVIAGKGHESYQEIKGVRYDFDDTVVVQEALREYGKVAN